MTALPPEMTAALQALTDELFTVVAARAEGMAASVLNEQGIRMTSRERDGFDAAIPLAVAGCLEALVLRGLIDTAALEAHVRSRM